MIYRSKLVITNKFPNHAILLCFFFFFFITDFLIPAVIAPIFIPTAELAISTGTQTNDANAEIETQTVTV